MSEAYLRKLLHICYIYPGYFPETHAGGIGVFAQEIVNLFAEKKHRITILSRSEAIGDYCEQISPNIILYRLGADAESLYDKSLKFRHTGFKKHYLKIAKLVGQVDARHHIDVIEACDWGAEAYYLLPKYLNRLLIRCHTPAFIAQAMNSNNPPYLSSGIMKAESLLISKAKRIACPSESLVEAIKKHITLRCVPHIEPYPLNTSSILQKKDYNIHANAIHILSVGRIEERKGQDILFQACHILAKRGYKIILTIFGADTPTINRGLMSAHFLKNLGLSNNIDFLLNLSGFLPRAELVKKYANFDIFVTASRFDNFPYNLLEAMVCGLPVVANDNSGMKKIVKDKMTGLLFSGAPRSLANKLLLFIKSADRRKSIGNSAREDIQFRFSKEKVYGALIKQYRHICQTSNT